MVNRLTPLPNFVLLFALLLAAVCPSYAAAQKSEALALDLRLIGTATGEGGLAIMQEPDGKVQFLEVGDETGGFTVKTIERDRVTFTRGDLETTIYLSTGQPRDGSIAAIRKEFSDRLAYIREILGEETPLQLSGDRLNGNRGGRYVNLRIPQELTGELAEVLRDIPLVELPGETINSGPFPIQASEANH